MLPTGPLSLPGATSTRPKEPQLRETRSDGTVRYKIFADVNADNYDGQVAEALFVLVQTGTFLGPDGALIKIRADHSGVYLQTRERIAKDLLSARWCRIGKSPDGDGDVNLITKPPATVVRTILGMGEYPGFPVLRALKTTPFLTSLRGEICTDDGYHPGTGYYLTTHEGLRLNVPDVIDQVMARAAYEELLEVVVDMPMADASKAGFVAAVLSVLARALTGPTPLFAILANVRSAGKSLLASLISLLCIGDEKPSPVKHTEDEAELEKRLAAVLREVPELINFDNVVGTFGGAALNMGLTSERFTTRELGVSRTLKVSCAGTTMLLTGNNCTFDGETIRRTVRIAMESKLARPELRTDFKHPDIVGWVKKNRSRLVSAAFVILRGYCQAGRPDLGLSKWGSFQRWSDLVRNAIVWAGGADCYTNTAAAEIDANSDLSFLENLVAALKDFCGTGGRTAGDIADAATRPHGPHKALSAALEQFKNPTGKISSRLLGREFMKLRNRRTEDGHFIGSTTVHKQALWYVGRDAQNN